MSEGADWGFSALSELAQDQKTQNKINDAVNESIETLLAICKVLRSRIEKLEAANGCK